MSDAPNPPRKLLAWLHGEVKSPPFSDEARQEAGELLGRVQEGESLSMPHSRPMPSIGARCHELRINDESVTWRIIYRIDPAIVLVLDVFKKKTAATPQQVIDACKARLGRFDARVRAEAARQRDEGRRGSRR